MIDALKRWLNAGILSIALLTTAIGLNTFLAVRPAVAHALTAHLPQDAVLISNLPAGNAITDGRALLRNALPIDNKAVRQVQSSLEEMSTPLRISRRKLSGINSYLNQADRVLTTRKADLLASVPADRQPQAETLIAAMIDGINDIRAEVEAQNRDAIWDKRSQLLEQVGQLEELMVAEFPYEVPEEYRTLPQLKGRATVEVTTNKGNMTLVVDGYSAPVTAGNFVDLVQRGFYDGLAFIRAEESYVLQIGDPPGKEDGFIDPATHEYRKVPLEVLVKGDKEPMYGITLEDAGRFREQPVLPFSAFGALGMARPGDDPNGGSSQFFFFLFEPELTPAGLNLLDGRFAVFGYVTEGKDVLDKLKQGDRIESARVVDGLDNLVEPEAA